MVFQKPALTRMIEEGRFDMVMKEPPMSDETMRQMQNQSVRYVENSSRQMEDMKDLVLRQWCIEKAVSVNSPDVVVNLPDVVKLARDMFDFITEKRGIP